MVKFASLMLACGMILLPSQIQAKPQELNFQTNYPPSQTQVIEVIQPWCESFGPMTNNDLLVHFFPVGTIVEMSEIRGATKSGMLDIGQWVPSSTPKENPYAYLANLPFFLKSSQHGTLAFWELTKRYEEVQKDLDTVGKTLAMFMGASYGFCGLKPVHSPADIKGKRVLIMIGTDAKVVEVWGGVPVFITPGDCYVGLQRGMGEQVLTALPYMKGLRLQEVAKYLTPLMISQSVMIFGVNWDVWEELTEQQRKWLTDTTGIEFSMRNAYTLDRDVSDVQGLFRKAGAEVVTLTDEQYQVFVEGARSMIDGYWVQHLKECGIPAKDVKMWMDRAYEVSASIEDPNTLSKI